MQISDVNLNQTERVRRLIPYMNFYVPINDYLPDNQAYSYNPMVSNRNHNHQWKEIQNKLCSVQKNGQKQVISLYQQQQQQIHQKQSTIQNPQQPRKQPQQQQLNRPTVYTSNTKYASHKPQPQTAIYNTRHQSNKPFDLPIQQTQRVNYNYAMSKVRFLQINMFNNYQTYNCYTQVVLSIHTFTYMFRPMILLFINRMDFELK